MACPAIITGDQFVTRVLTHIDCQARYLGSYGYEALGQPGSSAANVMAGLLTIFVALWAYRLLFGPSIAGRDVVGDVIKVGIVLTLAFSWPAFRTVVHDVALDGPASIAASLSTPGLPSTGSGFVERLQAADDAMVRLTDTGMGRRSGGLIEGQELGEDFIGTSLQDESALGWSRIFYLGGMVGSLALLRLLAGLLLALAPLAAGLLLFEATRGLFSGWLRGLVLALLGTLGVTIVLAVELVMLESLLADALYLRSQGYATPQTPVELLALSGAFAVIQLGIIWLLAKVAFMRGWPGLPRLEFPDWATSKTTTTTQPAAREVRVVPVTADRVRQLASHMEERVRVERNLLPAMAAGDDLRTGGSGDIRGGTVVVSSERLGSSYRRRPHAGSLSSRRRDGSA